MFGNAAVQTFQQLTCNIVFNFHQVLADLLPLNQSDMHPVAGMVVEVLIKYGLILVYQSTFFLDFLQEPII
jgi:hypothetical protein